MKRILTVLTFVLLAGLTSANCPKADITGDCKVTFADYEALAKGWLDEGCCPDLYPEQEVIECEKAMHLSLNGVNQGAIHGSCTVPGRENTIVVTDYSHQVYIPRDVHTGLPTGQRIHGPLTITKYTDKATPKMMQALVTGERMSVFELRYYRQLSDGSVQHYYTITLENAIIVDYEGKGPNVEEFSFMYSKITWSWEPDGIEAEDDWREPTA